MTVSIVIPNRNRRKLLLRLLDTIQRQHRPGGVELETIVVDNGSNDGSVEAAREWGARVVTLDENVGVSRAFNRGIDASRGELIALVNNDIELADDWLSALLCALEREDVWFATGKTLDYDDRGRIDGAGDAVCRGGTSWRLGHGKADGPWFNAERTTYFPSATATIYRRRFFERVGLLEETFFAYLEDVDLGLRAAAAGLAGAYVPRAAAYHRGSATAGAWSGATIEWLTCHQVLLLAKFYSPPMWMRFARAIAAAQILWAAMAISRGRGGAWLRGLARGFRLFRRMRASSGSLRARAQADSLSAVLAAAEQQIAQVQSTTSWDTYWKWYFRFVGPTAERAPIAERSR